MAERAAIVTGGSSGIGLAIAEMLAEEGYGVTLAARRPEKLEAAADGLRAKGHEIEHVAGSLADEDVIASVVAAHEARFGRLDVLVNNAGVGIGEYADELTTKKVDLMLSTNLRSVFLFYRKALPMLRRAGEEHRNALVVNMSSLTGIRGEPWLSVYSSTKHGVVGFSQSMNRELNSAGIKTTALCPGFVHTAMSEFVQDALPAHDMIQTSDITAAVRFLLSTTPGCVVPEIQFDHPGGGALPGLP